MQSGNVDFCQKFLECAFESYYIYIENSFEKKEKFDDICCKGKIDVAQRVTVVANYSTSLGGKNHKQLW